MGLGWGWVQRLGGETLRVGQTALDLSDSGMGTNPKLYFCPCPRSHTLWSKTGFQGFSMYEFLILLIAFRNGSSRHLTNFFPGASR